MAAGPKEEGTLAGLTIVPEMALHRVKKARVYREAVQTCREGHSPMRLGSSRALWTCKARAPSIHLPEALVPIMAKESKNLAQLTESPNAGLLVRKLECSYPTWFGG